MLDVVFVFVFVVVFYRDLVRELMISGAVAHSEYDAVRRFRDYIEIVDPDFLSGYNIINFDLPSDSFWRAVLLLLNLLIVRYSADLR